jgi:hypothetical protein
MDIGAFLLHVVEMPQNSWANGNMEHPTEVQPFVAHRCFSSDPEEQRQANSSANGNMELPPKGNLDTSSEDSAGQWKNASLNIAFLLCSTEEEPDYGILLSQFVWI